MRTSTAIVVGVVALAALGVGYLLLRPADRPAGGRTWGERLGESIGAVGDAVGSVERLFS